MIITIFSKLEVIIEYCNILQLPFQFSDSFLNLLEPSQINSSVFAQESLILKKVSIPQIKKGSQWYWRCWSEQAAEHDILVKLPATATCEKRLAKQLCHYGECYQKFMDEKGLRNTCQSSETWLAAMSSKHGSKTSRSFHSAL